MRRWSISRVRERLGVAAKARARADADRDEYAVDKVVAKMVARLSTVGYVVIPRYVVGAELDRLREEVDAVFTERAERVQTGEGGDRRMFGVEAASSALAAFGQDPFLARVGTAFVGPLATVTTMANRVARTSMVESSGGGWHRDRFARQFKVMLYLTDVGPENGPFCILPRTKSPWRTYLAHLLLGTPAEQRRWSDREMSRLLAVLRPTTLTGSAGTAVLFDSSCIHRGTELRSGERTAITNYYYEPVADSEARKLRKKLQPIEGLTRLRPVMPRR